MKKLFFLCIIALILSSCSKQEKEQISQKPIYTKNQSGESVEVPILIDELLFEDIHYYPLKGIDDYYGVQVRVSNKSDYIIEFMDIFFQGAYENEVYDLFFRVKEEGICQSDCKRPGLSFYGEMHFKGSIEYLPRFMNIKRIHFRIKSDKKHDFEYDFIKKTYKALY